MKKIKNPNKILHISIIVLGIIFILLSAFHADIWFDESYSVAIAKHNFADIWNISGNDVHPPLYYWMLHIVWMIFGNNVTIFRLFSVLAIIILGILGYTHIRKDFGENVGEQAPLGALADGGLQSRAEAAADDGLGLEGIAEDHGEGLGDVLDAQQQHDHRAQQEDGRHDRHQLLRDGGQPLDAAQEDEAADHH